MEKWRATYKRNKAITEAVIASAAAPEDRKAGDGQLHGLDGTMAAEYRRALSDWHAATPGSAEDESAWSRMKANREAYFRERRNRPIAEVSRAV